MVGKIEENDQTLRSEPTFEYMCIGVRTRLQKTVTCVVRIPRTFEVRPTLVDHHNAEMSPPTVEDAGPETSRTTACSQFDLIYAVESTDCDTVDDLWLYVTEDRSPNKKMSSEGRKAELHFGTPTKMRTKYR